MTRILLGVVAALVLAVVILWGRSESATERANAAESANQAQKQAIDSLGAEVVAQSNAAVEARKRDMASRARAESAAAELERLKRENSDIRAYLDSPVPAAAADWLWPLPDDNGNTLCVPPGCPATARSQTGASTVTHEEGWKWASAMERAYDDCEADRAAVMRWVAEHRAQR